MQITKKGATLFYINKGQNQNVCERPLLFLGYVYISYFSSKHKQHHSVCLSVLRTSSLTIKT